MSAEHDRDRRGADPDRRDSHVGRMDAALEQIRPVLPTAQALAAIGNAPIVDGRLASPLAVVWDGDAASAATLEVYAEGSLLAAVSRAVYRIVLSHPAFASLARLDLDGVACVDVPSVHLLGDPIPLLAAEGVPRSVRRLGLAVPAMVTHAGDVGYRGFPALAPLHRHLDGVEHLDIAACETLGRLSLTHLRGLRIGSSVSVRNLRELARAELPNLESLVLACDDFAEPELRLAGVRAVLRSAGLPALRELELSDLDVDEDQHAELDEQGGDPKPWTPVIARSALLPRLRRLELAFKDIEREADLLVRHAAAFAHLEALVLDRGAPIAHPTRASIAAALGR
ncbi:MAG: hypothetical protein U1A78_01200 [Polyangia bacterium]